MKDECTEQSCDTPGYFVVQDGDGPDTQRRVCKRHALAHASRRDERDDKPNALATITPRLLDVVAGLRNQHRQYDVPDDSVTPAHLLLLKEALAAHIDELAQIAQVAVLANGMEE